VAMLKKPIFSYLICLIIIGLTNCQTIGKKNSMPFKMNFSYYQPWVMSEKERGIDIVLRITCLQKGIEFDSIVFNGVKLPSFTTKEKGGIMLKSILPIGLSRIRIGSEVTGEPDQLIYRIKGERKTYLLSNLERKETINYSKPVKIK